MSRNSYQPSRTHGTSTSSATTSGGLGFSGFLALLFIGLKLTGYISWSWLWVLSPLWIPLVIVLGLIFFTGIGYIIYSIFSSRK